MKTKLIVVLSALMVAACAGTPPPGQQNDAKLNCAPVGSNIGHSCTAAELGQAGVKSGGAVTIAKPADNGSFGNQNIGGPK